MTSATFLAWVLAGVERSSISCPGLARLSEALKVANRTVRSLLPLPAAAGRVAAIIAMSMTAIAIERLREGRVLISSPLG
jgi:hypothetical protein